MDSRYGHSGVDCGVLGGYHKAPSRSRRERRPAKVTIDSQAVMLLPVTFRTCWFWLIRSHSWYKEYMVKVWWAVVGRYEQVLIKGRERGGLQSRYNRIAKEWNTRLEKRERKTRQGDKPLKGRKNVEPSTMLEKERKENATLFTRLMLENGARWGGNVS